ncbi:MAG: hypothetical protein ACX931_07520 [Saccharospirillum sp.]
MDLSNKHVLGVMPIIPSDNQPNNTALELVAHQPPTQPEWIIVECLPLCAQQWKASESEHLNSLARMQQSFRLIESCKTLDEVIIRSTATVQKLTQYDMSCCTGSMNTGMGRSSLKPPPSILSHVFWDSTFPPVTFLHRHARFTGKTCYA